MKRIECTCAHCRGRRFFVNVWLTVATVFLMIAAYAILKAKPEPVPCIAFGISAILATLRAWSYA